MRTKSILPMLAVLPMLGLAAGGALAQPRGPMPPAGPDAGGPPRPPMARFCEDAPARQAARLAYLQEKLKLRADQQQAWNTFATQAKAAAQPMQKLCEDRPAPPPPGEARAPRPAPDASAMLSRQETRLAAQLESTKALRAAVDGFTPSLSAEQKETMGQLLQRAAMKMQRARMHEHHRGPHRDHRDHGPRDHGPREGGTRL